MILMMEAVSYSETSVSIYETTRCNTPEDSRLHTRRRENPKSYFNGFDVHLLQTQIY
jgi:hypothetical protein